MPGLDPGIRFQSARRCRVKPGKDGDWIDRCQSANGFGSVKRFTTLAVMRLTLLS
jgi:hypothetical protein